MNIVMLLKPKETVAYIYENSTIGQALEKMKAHSYTAVPVIDEYGKYVGTVSEGDFLWYIVEKQTQGIKSQEKYFVRDLIRTDFNPSVKISVDMKELYERALNQNFIPVTDDSGVFIGIVTRKDLISHFVDKSRL